METQTMESSVVDSTTMNGTEEVEGQPEIADIVVEGQPEIADIVVEGQPEIVVEDHPEIVVEGPPEIVVEDQHEIVVEGQPEIVVEGQPEIVVEGQPEIVVEGQPEIVVDVEGQPEIVIDVPPQKGTEGPRKSSRRKRKSSRLLEELDQEESATRRRSGVKVKNEDVLSRDANNNDQVLMEGQGQSLLDPSLVVSRTNSARATRKLVHAMSNNDLKGVVSSLDDGADVNHRMLDADGMTLLMKAVELGDLSLVHILCQKKAKLNLTDDFGITALMLAGVRDQPEIVRYLLAVGANPGLTVKSHGMTALHGMAKEDSYPCVKALNLPARLQLLCAKDVDSLTPLMTAAKFGAYRVVTYLAELMTEYSLRNMVTFKDQYGGTALHWGAFSGDLEILAALINLGADLNAKDNQGDTPLHVMLSSAIKRPNTVQGAKALITAGAEHNITNNSGNTPLDMCDLGVKLRLTRWIDQFWKNKAVTLGSSLATTNQAYVLNPDISGGREKNFAVQCINDFDSATLTHGQDFFYITESTFGTCTSLDSVENIHRCYCGGKCNELESCSCSVSSEHGHQEVVPGRNGSLPVNGTNILLNSLYECNQLCPCNVGECPNRLVQKGLGQLLEIFRTDNDKGWGVRSMREIPAGDFVMELVGERISYNLAVSRANKDFLYEVKIDRKSRIYMDCGKYGNVGRFINHSCDPNLIPVKVFVNSLIPRIAFFAGRDIQPGEELTFDYTTLHFLSCNIRNVKKLYFQCKCESSNCVALNL